MVNPVSASKAGSPTPEAKPVEKSVLFGPAAKLASPVVKITPDSIPIDDPPPEKKPADVALPTKVALPTAVIPFPSNEFRRSLAIFVVESITTFVPRAPDLPG